MREVVISVHCDYCQEVFAETTEGSNSVTFAVEQRRWQMDLCYQCLGGPFFENARLVDKVKDFTCYCGKSFSSQRGLKHHQTRMAHD